VKRRRWLEGLGVFAVSLLYLRALPDCFSLFDEGIFASIAERLLRGEQLHRDVFTHYFPATFWLLKLLFEVAGCSVASLRVSLALLAAAAATAVWRLARDHTGAAPAVLAGVSVTFVCYPLWWMASPHWYSTFTALAVALLLRSAITATRPEPWLLATGFASGLTLLFLQPVGAAVAVAVAAAVFWDGLWTSSMRDALWRVFVVGSGVLLPLASTFAYFAAQGLLPTMLSETLLWNVHNYAGAFHIAYGVIPFGLSHDLATSLARGFVAALPPVAYATALAVVLRCYVGGRLQPRDRMLLSLLAIAVGLLVGNLYYPDIVHLAAAAPPGFAVLAALIERAVGASRSRSVLVAAWATMVCSIGVAAWRRSVHECPERLDTPRGRIAATAASANDLRQFLAYVSSNVPPAAALFVYPYAPGYYFLTGHPNATRHEYLFPYLPGAQSESQLREVVADLEAKQPQFIVLSLLWGRAMLAHYDTPVERYIRASYHIAKELPLTVLLERDTPGRRDPKIIAQP
jgi:hypothetical protein